MPKLSNLTLLLALAAAPVCAQQRPVSLPPASPDVLRAGFIASMDAEFRTKDADKDGKLTRAEIELYERNAAMAVVQEQNRRFFTQLDKDGNGALSPAEFASLAAPPQQPDVAPLMTRFDSNRDQNVTLVEYRAATLANFDRLDVDHDGVVTGAEMRAGGVQPQGR